jgi:hypothetical protein
MRFRAAAAVVLSVAVLSACAPVQTAACASWVDYETPAAMAGAADLVFVGEVTGLDGVTQNMGVDATARTIRIDELLVGDAGGATEIRVLSRPDACSGTDTFYPEGDPLDVDGAAEFFLFDDAGTWVSLTPLDGAVEVPASGELPWSPDAEPLPTESPAP